MVLLQQMQTIAYHRPCGIAMAVNRGEVHLLRRPRLDIKRQTKVEKTHAPVQRGKCRHHLIIAAGINDPWTASKISFAN